MTTAREEVRKLLERLPEDATFKDIQYHIYVQSKVERALEAARAGDVLTQEEIERRMAKWLDP